MAEEQFEDTGIENVEARIQYKLARLPAISNWLLEMATIGEDVYLCHRKDYHEDKSSTHYYYIELSRKQFLAMGGKELKAQGAQDEN